MTIEALLIGGPRHLERISIKDRRIQRFDVACNAAMASENRPIDASQALEARNGEAATGKTVHRHPKAITTKAFFKYDFRAEWSTRKGAYFHVYLFRGRNFSQFHQSLVEVFGNAGADHLCTMPG